MALGRAYPRVWIGLRAWSIPDWPSLVAPLKVMVSRKKKKKILKIFSNLGVFLVKVAKKRFLNTNRNFEKLLLCKVDSFLMFQ